MKQFKGKMIFALIVAAFVLCGSMGVAAAETPADSVNTVVYADVQMYGAFSVPYQMVKVNSYLAESYGYADQVDYKDSASTLDVMVKLHELKYGSAFTAATCKDYLDVASDGWVLKAFNDTTGGWSAAVNGEGPHDNTWTDWGYGALLINQAPVEMGDIVDIIKYQDLTNWGDSYLWTMEYGNYVRSESVDTGEDLDLTVKGFGLMMYGTYGETNITNDHLTAVSGAHLAIMNKDGSLTDITGAVTDANGDVTVSFDKAGNYILVAYLPSDNTTKAFMTVINVHVTTDMDSSAFTDLKSDGWYLPAVDRVVAAGFMQGTTPTTFAPDQPLTRAMFVTILHRIFGEPNSTQSHPFTDVPSNSWYSAAVTWAYAMGITDGVSPTKFAPNEGLSRQDMATLLMRCFVALSNGKMPADTTVDTYSDDAEIAAYAKDAVYALSKADVIHGVGDGKFAPKATATRAQVAQMFANLMKNAK